MTIDTKHLAELARAATPGPWKFTRHTSDIDGAHSASDDWTVTGVNGNAICFEGNSPTLVDPEYIAAASPDVILSLIAANEALTKENAELRADAERYQLLRTHQSLPADILMNHHEALDKAVDQLRSAP